MGTAPEKPAPEPKSRSWLLPGISVAAIAAIGLAGYFSTRAPPERAPAPRPEPPPVVAPAAAVVADPSPAPAAASMVTLHLTSEPPGAEVHLLVVPESSTLAAAGEPLALGTTPIDVDLPASRVPANAELHFRVTKTGYQPLDVTRFASGTHIEASFTLARRAGGAAAPTTGSSSAMAPCVGPLCGFR